MVAREMINAKSENEGILNFSFIQLDADTINKIKHPTKMGIVNISRRTPTQTRSHLNL